jgi:hypothetical protein
MYRKAPVCLLALGVFLLPLSAATLTTFTDRTTFETALASFSTITFDAAGVTQGSYRDYSTAGGYTESGVNFVGNNGCGGCYNLTVQWGAFGGPSDFGSDAVLVGPYYNAGSFIQVTLSSAVTAVGFDLMTMVPGAGSILVTMPADLGGGTYTVATANRPNRTWFGVTSDTPFTTLQIAAQNPGPSSPQPILDNFEFGDTGAPTDPVPEVPTFLLMGTGLASLRYTSRWLPSKTRLAAVIAHRK